jgi:hypothetical protein
MEFPHDNPLLGSGARPLPSSATRPRRMILATCTPVTEATPLLEALATGAVEAPAIARGAGALPDDFGNYVGVMVRTLLDSGATRAASMLQTWLHTGRLEAAGLDEAARGCLRAAGYLEPSGDDRPTECAQRTLEAWRAVLSGQSSDLSASGERTLDEWSAGLVTALLGRSEQVAGEIKKRLRRAGIAAFGMIDQAA